MTVPRADVEQPLEPMWRGLLVYRVLTLLVVAVVAMFALDEFGSPAGAVAVLVAMGLWTAVAGSAYLGRGPVARERFALPDLAVTVGVMATTPLVQTPAQLAADAPVMGSIWTPGAALACALAYGLRWGLLGAVVLSAALLAVQARVETEVYDIQLIVLASLTIGFAATVLRRSAARVRRAVAAEAAAAERERLARAVHDGVLQVLAHVRRRGAELGGGAAELGALAGEQEVALRTLLTTGPVVTDADGRRDLAAAVRALASPRVTVSAPAHPVALPAHSVDELVAVVGAALTNVAVHVGATAPAWVLVEDLGDAVEIAVRDDGPGIPEGRLAAAAAEGRLGVARSMRGRVRDLGATITLETGPGRGTEWTVRVPAQGSGAGPRIGTEGSLAGPSIDTEGSRAGPSIGTEGSLAGPSIGTEGSLAGPSIGTEGSLAGPSIDTDGSRAGPSIGTEGSRAGPSIGTEGSRAGPSIDTDGSRAGPSRDTGGAS